MMAPIKLKTKEAEQVLETDVVLQATTAEPTAPGDQSSTPTALKPTPATKKTKRKTTRKPTKPTPKATLEDEIPELMPVTTQKSQETTAATSSQQLVQRSQPHPKTPPASSQKDQVVSTGTPQYEALDPLGSIFHSPDPKDMSLSTPTPSPIILPQSIIPLLHAVDIAQTKTSSSQSPITESIPLQVTGSDAYSSAIPATIEEVTPPELQVTLGGSSSGAATTTDGSTDLQLDSCFLSKTPLKAISSIASMKVTSEYVLPIGTLQRLTSAEERSPQYQEQGASMDDFWDSLPKSHFDTTTAGGDSDDPSHVGDDSRYQELTNRVEKIEGSVAEIKEMVQEMLKAQKAQTTAAPAQASAPQAFAANELWSIFQPMLEQQQQMAAKKHALQMQMLTNMVESRFKDTQADIKAIKASIQQNAQSEKGPSTIFFMDTPLADNAKKGEKIKLKKKGIEDGLYVEPEKPKTADTTAVTKTAASSQTAATSSTHTHPTHTTLPQNTTTTVPPPPVSTTQKSSSSKPKTTKPSSPPAKRQKTIDVITSVVMTTGVETPVVSTSVSQPLITSQSTAIITPAQKQKTTTDTSVVVMTTAVETPVVSTVVSQPSITALSSPISQPRLFSKKRKPITATEGIHDPNAAKYPLELEAIKNEMRQFYTEEDSTKRRFSSLIGFMPLEDMSDYLKIKARQAKVKAKFDSEKESLSEEAIAKRLEFYLTKVKQIEEFAQELEKEKADQKKELREQLLAYIMKEKFYPAEEQQFKEWPLVALKHEAERIQKIKNDPTKKKNAPNWSKYKKLIADLTAEYKRKKKELVEAKMDTAEAISKWSRQQTDEAYERLKNRKIVESRAAQKREQMLKLEQHMDNLKTVLKQQTILLL
ncbi:hypothetical protein Hanom_Chr16g01473511 [Helianthus anomalus]